MPSTDGASAAPYDALLVVSFGGPEEPADVLPFLENVTRGRGIPRERLEEVGQHYFLFGGRSPINDQCRALIAAVEKDLAAHGVDLPVYWGNRNWDPYLDDTLARMRTAGVRRAACFVTSAYASYSGCRQYRENLFDAVAAVEGAPRLDKLRHYFNHPGFVSSFVDTTMAAVGRLPEDHRADARLVFVTHSIPVAMAEGAGPDGGAYVAQHREVARMVADEVGRRTGARPAWDLVYCSRSGPPQVPWLEPDVNDHLDVLAADGTDAVVVVPIGFVSDHMEVVYDLDTEARRTADRAGLAYERAGTPGVHPAFVSLVRNLVLERAAHERGEGPSRQALGALGASWDVCAAHCCPNPRGERATSALPAPRRRRPGDGGRVSNPTRSRELLDLAVTTARAAGELVLQGREGPVEVADTKSSPTDVVTANDLASEQLIRSRILSSRPDDGFLGEEGSRLDGTSGVRWIADPIDGTVNYLYGIPQYAVSIAAEEDGQVVAAAVLAPTSGELFSAVRGEGAWLDGHPIQVSAVTEVSRALTGTGYHYRADVREHQAAELARLVPRVRDIRRLGSAALDLCYVASGRLDAYVERGLRPWDLAAARLVVEESGGRVGGLQGAEPGELITVAAPEPLFGTFEECLVDCGFADWTLTEWPPER